MTTDLHNLFKANDRKVAEIKIKTLTVSINQLV